MVSDIEYQEVLDHIQRAKAEIKRLQAIADAVSNLPIGDGSSTVSVPKTVAIAIHTAWLTWKEAAEAAKEKR